MKPSCSSEERTHTYLSAISRTNREEPEQHHSVIPISTSRIRVRSPRFLASVHSLLTPPPSLLHRGVLCAVEPPPVPRPTHRTPRTASPRPAAPCLPVFIAAMAGLCSMVVFIQCLDIQGPIELYSWFVSVRWNCNTPWYAREWNLGTGSSIIRAKV